MCHHFATVVWYEGICTHNSDQVISGVHILLKWLFYLWVYPLKAIRIIINSVISEVQSAFDSPIGNGQTIIHWFVKCGVPVPENN